MSFPTFTSTYRKALYPRISPSLPSLSTKGKTVVITGGGRGIGQAIARNFLISGANVFILGRSEATLREAVDELTAVKSSHDTTTGAEIGYHPADVTDPEAVKSAIAAAVKKFGEIDILVNNAAYVDARQPVSSSDLEDFWRAYEVNVKGSLVVLQAFLKHAKSNATVINVSSAASMGVFAPISAYSSSKIALVRILDHLQVEEPSFRVFNIHPGNVETKMSKGVEGLVNDDDPNLPGAFCVWLASEEADFLKGRFVWSGWDVAELVEKKDLILSNNMLTFQLSGWPAGLQG